jgi:diguanylate cyclase (GGDEF)-like protein
MSNRPTEQTRVRRETIFARQEGILVQIYPAPRVVDPPLLLRNRPVVLGRDEECDIALDNELVSRQHARIDFHNGGFVLTDLTSTNGTFVNETPIRCARLKDGDVVRLGEIIFRFLTGDNVEIGYHLEMHRLCMFDALTGVSNRRCLEQFLDRELTRSFRHQRPLGLLMIDVDRFKAINDRLGHLAGDYVLRELGQCLRSEVRTEDLLARYGGDEFAWVLVETDEAGASACAARARCLVAGHRFSWEGAPFSVQISVGTAVVRKGEVISSAELLNRADETLYQAKEVSRGRDRRRRLIV